MNSASRYIFLGIVAMAALGLTLHNVKNAGGATLRIKRKMADLERVETLQARNEQIFSAMKILGDAGPPRPIEQVLAGRTAEVHPRKDLPLIEGWSLKAADVIFNEIALSDAAGFIADAENARPPWRVAECAITPAAAGFGRVALVMQSVEMKNP